MSVQQRAFHVLQRGSLQALYFTYILSLLIDCCILPVKCAPPATVNDRPTSTNDFNAKSWFGNNEKSPEKTVDSAKQSKNDGDFQLSQNRNPADKEATAGTGGGSLRQPETKSNASPQKEQDREKAVRPSVRDESQTPRQESAKSPEIHEPRPRTDADKTSSDVKSSLAAPPTEKQSDQAVPARYGSSKLTGNADKEPNPPSSNGLGQSEKTATQSGTRNGGGGDQQRVSVPKSGDKKDTESDRTQTIDKTADANVGKRRETESEKTGGKTETKPSTGAVGDTETAQEEEEKEEQVTTAPYNWTMPAHLTTYVEDITASLKKIRNAGITEDPRTKELERASMEPATPNATARDLSDHERQRMSGNVDDEMKNRQSAGKIDATRKDSPSMITDRPAASGALPGSRPVSGGNSEKSQAGQQQSQQQPTAQDAAPKKSLESTGLAQQTSLDARNQSSKLKNGTSATITDSSGVKQQSLRNTTTSADVQMKPTELNKTAPKSDKPASSAAQPSAPSVTATSGESQKTMDSKKETQSITTTTEAKKNEDQTGEEDYEEREDQQPQPPPQTSDRQSQEEFGKDTNKSEVKPQTANKQPADIGQPKPPVPPIKPESEDSHFMLYMVTGIISVALIYLLYHNKQKILGLIVEGRVGSSGSSTRRHNGRRYRKLEQNEDDSGFTKPTNIIY